ncbi:expressed protein [Chlorella variabilis]|uniref:Expressed protein n=1 Tax=Chlorella variabilis TaxID=554065 RepID=E1Z335_CHLVA|nr:expressed protein [Chlorella variabilis]EFN59768.1 expressed protein [Chlorella variabilis]|eukprot:XP_005851870.1 expressed protein [Chlorella variabilis]
MDGSVACPLQTQLPQSWHEQFRPGTQLPEIRAYKLGKKRWSYNQVELVLGEEGGTRTAAVQQALHASGAKFPEAHQDSAVGFLIQLESGVKVQAHVYLCYDRQPGDACGASGSGRGRGPALVPGSDHFAWNLVTRKHCCKGCEGRVLRSIQRFGRLGKRCRGGEAKAAPPPEPAPIDANGEAGAAPAGHGSRKDPRYMYLSLDEACTHVDAAAFRLVAGIYNRQGTRLLTTAVSPPIRVLANNDVPTGAARISLEARLPACPPTGRGGAPRLAARRRGGRPPRRACARVRPSPAAASWCPGSGALSQARPASMRQLARQQSRQQQQQQQQQSCGHSGAAEAWPLAPGALGTPPRRSPPRQLPEAPKLSPSQASLLACGSVGSTGEAGSGGRLRHVGSSTIKQEQLGDGDVYSIEGSCALHVGRFGSLEMDSLGNRGCPEPPEHWLAPAGHADISAVAAGFVRSGDAAAQAEAERQLRLLRELKAKLLAASNQEASSGCEVSAAAPSSVGCAPAAAREAEEHVSPSIEAPASPSAHDWLPAAAASDTMLPAESLMEHNLGLPLLLLEHGSGGFGGADDEDEQLHTIMLPGHHEHTAIEMLDMRMPPLFDDAGPLLSGHTWLAPVPVPRWHQYQCHHCLPPPSSQATA